MKKVLSLFLIVAFYLVLACSLNLRKQAQLPSIPVLVPAQKGLRRFKHSAALFVTHALKRVVGRCNLQVVPLVTDSAIYGTKF